MDSIRRIKVQQLQVGMYVTEISDEQAADNHLKAEGLITRPKTVERIQAMGVAEVYIDVSKGRDSPGSELADDIQAGHEAELQSIVGGQSPPQVSFDEEHQQAVEIRGKALALVGDVMQDVKMGRCFDRAAVDTITSEITASLTNNQNALSSLMCLRNKDQYLLEHSMNVAVLMGILARSHGYQDQALHELVLGAFVHDVGKIRVPAEILYKPGKLEMREWAEMKRHVNYGIEALERVDGLPQVARDICAQHHERLDGSGYPFGLAAKQISDHGRMASVVDVYDAITADRVYHDGMTPTTALKKMLEWSGDHLDRPQVYQLIRSVSVYPAGALVQLASGYVALVQEVNVLQPDRPTVKLVYNIKRKAVLKGRVVCLSDTDIYGKIEAAVAPALYGIDLKVLL